MKPRTLIRYAVAVAVFGGLCALAAYFAPSDEEFCGPGWYCIIPPVLAICLAFLTRHVVFSLGIAILAGGFLIPLQDAPSRERSWTDGFKMAGGFVLETVRPFHEVEEPNSADTEPNLAISQTNQNDEEPNLVGIVPNTVVMRDDSKPRKFNSNLMILAFLPPVFVMIEVIIASGGFKGIVLWLLRRVKGGKSAQLATALMGLLCFIDDYANAIIIGSMMQPITDRFRISREKLAFIVDATSAPVAGLAVVSTWIAYEVGLLGQISDELELGRGGYSLFFDALSFRFYCLLMLGFVFIHIILARDFGAMKKAETTAKQRGDKNGRNDDSKDAADWEYSVIPERAARAIKALIPLGGLLLFHIAGLWVDGGGPGKLSEGASLLSLTYWREVISAAKNTHLILDCAALFGLALALICSQTYGSVRPRVLQTCVKRGVKRAMIPFVILILAWSLKNCCDSLMTGKFLTMVLADRVSSDWFAPAVFLIASLTSFATGTSYGTMAILIPTAVPIAFSLDGDSYGLTTMITIGAVLDGAIFGDHCSPISDTTIMSSIASSCDLMKHVRTQLPYSLFVAAIALTCAYVPSAMGLAPSWSLLTGITVITCILLLLTRSKSADIPG